MKRSSGVLLHITSLPGRYGIGTLGKEARAFAGFCHKAGIRWWQVLPVGPTGYGNSPYQSDSVFAGNPQLIDLEALIWQGLLTRRECQKPDWGEEKDKVSFEKIKAEKPKLLHLAFLRARKQQEIWTQVKAFIQQERDWLPDYALYCALKEEQGGKPWTQWEEGIKKRQQKALEDSRRRLHEKIEYFSFLQYLFYSQWSALKEYCNRKGVFLIGDIPIYVAPDSCDTWVNTRLFMCSEDGRPLKVAGCPPDYFSKTGQLWGNPLYRWDVMEQEEYRWWIARIGAMSRLFDLTRIDHFRGFAGYYAIDASEKTAENGHWEQGPGEKLFLALQKALPKVRLIAEDLGTITPDVDALRAQFHLPGMKVLQFAFSVQEQSSYLPHNCPKRAVIYTGTHDNDTSRGWAHSISKQERRQAGAYMGVKKEKDFAWAMIRTAWTSPCELAIAPMQDFLNLPSSARMNTPSTVGDNWSWRMRQLPDRELAKKIRQLNRASWRLPVYRSGVQVRSKQDEQLGRQ